MISPVQARMARVALRLHVREVAKSAGVNFQTLSRFEREKIKPHSSTLERIAAYFSSAGIEFIADNGVIFHSSPQDTPENPAVTEQPRAALESQSAQDTPPTEPAQAPRSKSKRPHR